MPRLIVIQDTGAKAVAGRLCQKFVGAQAHWNNWISIEDKPLRTFYQGSAPVETRFLGDHADLLIVLEIRWSRESLTIGWLGYLDRRE